jgi:hypothetical protein
VNLTGFAGDNTIRRLEIQNQHTGPTFPGTANDNICFDSFPVQVMPTGWGRVKAIYR